MRLVDHTAGGHGRRYLIERELTVMAELEAIVADYEGWRTASRAAPSERARPAKTAIVARDRAVRREET